MMMKAEEAKALLGKILSEGINDAVAVLQTRANETGKVQRAHIMGAAVRVWPK